MNISIARNSGVPIYLQVVEQVKAKISQGIICDSAKLPTERDLAEGLGVARGTVRKAYDRLAEEGIISVTQGRGSFVSVARGPRNRKDQAVKSVSSMIDKLCELGFDLSEIGNMVHLMLKEREDRINSFHIAAIDCNPEALAIYERQLLRVAKQAIHKFLLADLRAERNPAERFAVYDLIITTTTHYEELSQMLPGLKGKMVQAVVGPGEKTIMDIAGIDRSAAIGLIARSSRFLDIMKQRLQSFSVGLRVARSAESPDEGDLMDLLKHCDILITPPGYFSMCTAAVRSALADFSEHGGRVISFEYLIEKGSLMYINERITSLMQKQDQS